MPRLDTTAVGTAPRLDLTPGQLDELRQLLARHVPEAEVWAYGSRVNGGGHEGSDLDLVLRNVPDLVRPVAGWLALVEALQDSALPMIVEVHDWARLPVSFHAEIARRHVVVQAGVTAACG